jgi:hypothetical protein
VEVGVSRQGARAGFDLSATLTLGTRLAVRSIDVEESYHEVNLRPGSLRIG